MTDKMYVNINSISYLSPDKWIRGKQIKDLLKVESDGLIEHKNKGSWLRSDMFDLFGEWLRIKTNGEINITLADILQSRVDHEFFRQIGGHKLRANRNTHFIVLTDIADMFEKDLRTWKKTKEYKQYITIHPSDCLSSNNTIDDLGMRITLTHPRLALQYLAYIKRSIVVHPEIELFVQEHKDALNHTIDSPLEIYCEEFKNGDSNSVLDLGLINLKAEDFEGCRMTPDGLFSVYDAIAKFRECDGRRAREAYQTVEAIIQPQLLKYQFKRTNGANGPAIPVASFSQLLSILSQLPGHQAKQLRREQAEISTRAIAGDEDLEQAVRYQRDNLSENDRSVLMTGLSRRSKRFGISIEPYREKSVVYCLEFIPSESELISNDGLSWYNFGVTSDIERRLVMHRADKSFKHVRLDKCFVYPCRNSAGRGERHFKNLLSDMGKDKRYGSKIECFQATENEKSDLYFEMEHHTSLVGSSDDILDDFNRIKLQTIDNLLRDGVITFSEFVEYNKQCLS